jgi:hypothetical protein
MTTADSQRLPDRPRPGGNQAFKRYRLRLYPGTGLICARKVTNPAGGKNVPDSFGARARECHRGLLSKTVLAAYFDS